MPGGRPNFITFWFEPRLSLKQRKVESQQRLKVYNQWMLQIWILWVRY
jgi:hypothetical protein